MKLIRFVHVVFGVFVVILNIFILNIFVNDFSKDSFILLILVTFILLLYYLFLSRICTLDRDGKKFVIQNFLFLKHHEEIVDFRLNECKEIPFGKSLYGVPYLIRYKINNRNYFIIPYLSDSFKEESIVKNNYLDIFILKAIVNKEIEREKKC